MTLSGSSSEETPEFLVYSKGTKVDIPPKVVLESIVQTENDLLIYIDQEGNKHMFLTDQLEDDKYYNVTIIDDSHE